MDFSPEFSKELPQLMIRAVEYLSSCQHSTGGLPLDSKVSMKGSFIMIILSISLTSEFGEHLFIRFLDI